ncbi:MAG TPA: peptide chain release factor 1 [Actinomycetota bacterium]|jgi:peptide chain release factor 1|nr:peptide chain release factor 1 [Actinomycetota bacterium]
MEIDDRLREIESRYEQVQADLASPETAADPERMRDLGRSYAELDAIVRPYREYRRTMHDAEEAHELARVEADAEMAEAFEEEAAKAEERAESLRSELEQLLVPKDPNDGKDLIVEIRAGTGGQEAALWAGDLFEMYRHLAERRRWKSEVLSSSPSELGGFKEIVLEVRGRDAYGRLKHESGVHRVQRVPATESKGRTHTSTATVAVMPEAEEVEVEIRPEDLDIDVYRSSGPGGQSVNTTDSAVRIVHRPTGIKVEVQEERSQLQNREKAMRYLRARLQQKALEEQQEKEAAARRSMVGTGERSEKIRTYNYAEGRVTDHRIKYTTHQLADVLEGGPELDGFTDRLNAAERSAQLAEGS